MLINIFDNSYTEGVSGGNVRSVQIFKNIKNPGPDLKIRIVTSEKGGEFYKNFGLSSEVLLSSREKKVTNFYWTYFFRLCKLSFLALRAKFRGQLVYANSDYLVDVLPAFLSKVLYHTKWIQICQLIISHPRARENSLSNYLAYYFQRASFLLMRRADLIITDGYEIREILINKFKFSPDKVDVGFLGIDSEFIDTVELSEKTSDLIFVGTLDNRKGIKDFIEICTQLKKYLPDFKAVVIARKTNKIKELEDVVRKGNISKNITFTGELGQKQIFSLLKSSKIFLYPSLNESWALVICEAIACGTLCLARNLAAYKKIYEDNIIYCDSNRDFSDKVKLYLKNQDLRKDLAQKSRLFIQRYDWKKVAEKELGFINNILYNHN